MEPEKKPLAIYKERTLFRTQDVLLYPDRIEATGKADWTSEWEWSYELRNLSDQFLRGRVRNKLFNFGLSIFMLWAAALGVLTAVPQVDLLSSKWGLFYAVPLFSIAMLLASARKHRYVVIRAANGSPILQILDSGDGDKFDRFTALLLERIQEQRSLQGSPGHAAEEEKIQPS